VENYSKSYTDLISHNPNFDVYQLLIKFINYDFCLNFIGIDASIGGKMVPGTRYLYYRSSDVCFYLCVMIQVSASCNFSLLWSYKMNHTHLHNNTMPQQKNEFHRNGSGTAPTSRTHVVAAVQSNRDKSSSNISSSKRQMEEQLPRFSTILVARSNNTRPTGTSFLFQNFASHHATKA
jgi:hypothetical protein